MTEVKKEKLKDRFGVTKFPATLQPRYNISPTQDVASILNESPETLSLTRWGLVSFRAKDPAIGNRMINARAETIAQKPAFKKLIKEKRCLILADSFFEWKREKKIKRPFRIMLKDEGLFAFAGLWDTWEKEGKRVVTCLIITTDSNSLLSRIHDRMPVILSKENEKAWVSSEIAVPEALRMLKPYDPGAMRACEISTFVNSPAHDTPAVLESLNKTCE